MEAVAQTPTIVQVSAVVYCNSDLFALDASAGIDHELGQAMSTQTSVAPGPILSTALALSVFAAIASLSGTLLKAPAAMTPILIWTPILLSVAAYQRSGRVRSYLLSVPMGWIFIVQAIRAPVGIFFLIQESRGTLPASLAATAGWGDLLFGGVSALLLWKPSGSRTVLILWNTIGLLEIH